MVGSATTILYPAYCSEHHAPVDFANKKEIIILGDAIALCSWKRVNAASPGRIEMCVLMRMKILSV